MNLLTDIEAVKVGHCSDFKAGTGCTVILLDRPALGAVDIRGGGTSTRQIDSLVQNSTYGKINAILLTGGSAYGLNATAGVLKYLETKRVGLDVGYGIVVPSVPSAVIFDLGIGNGNVRPNEDMAFEACLNASSGIFDEGSVGVGTGATIGKIFGVGRSTKGGLASQSFKFDNGVVVGVLVVVNAFGDVLSLEDNQIIAGVRDDVKKNEFLGTVNLIKEGVTKSYEPFSSTTLAVVVTNASLTKQELFRVAKIGHTGMARVINPVNTISDGDIVFSISIGEKKGDANSIGVVASDLISEAINRSVIKAKGLLGIPSYSDISL